MKSEPRGMSVDELVARFADIALGQDKALLRGEIAKFNRLFDRMKEVEDELRDRAGDRRRALLPLYDHPNPQVRLTAIKATLAVAPDVAMPALRMLAESREYPQSGDAGMSIWALEEGIFKPS